ncbi:hypothetical protein DERP_012929 [Dermatophagoides pteronyssinus]|uniref:Uncharacterized protein n=1 Tax=Dermatophagoides pteronyssinus TaxID=6956 RepID=A0ABQ8J3T9_DERPT|nr:hypothetical protein DERP_012929 [Dermatophagoides pteronyssinus]
MRNRNNSNNFFIQHWQQNSSDNFDEKFYEIFDHMSSPTPSSATKKLPRTTTTPRTKLNKKINFEFEQRKRMKMEPLKIYPPIKLSLSSSSESILTTFDDDVEKCRQKEEDISIILDPIIDYQSE